MNSNMTSSSSFKILITILLTLLITICETRGGRQKTPPTFEETNLEKRPLNFYVIANAKHAKVENRTANINAHKIPYRESTPPFKIKQRGEVLLLPSVNQTSLDFHKGYPSIIQMLAASGHRIVVPDMPRDNHDDLAALISYAEVHNPILIAFGESDSNAVKYFKKSGNGRGLILVNPKMCLAQIAENPSVNCLTRKFNEEVIQAPLLILAPERIQLGDLFKNRQSLVFQGDIFTEEGQQLLMKLFNNYLEFLSPR